MECKAIKMETEYMFVLPLYFNSTDAIWIRLRFMEGNDSPVGNYEWNVQ